MAEYPLARYIGRYGAYLEGVPARDLTADEWDAVPEALRERALQLKLYALMIDEEDSEEEAEEVEDIE